ncbi:uncharacterized protein DNG_00330 [Cephalotrichum gorgonifer]|uniref:Uncharacterized protein n=1 Tax=Cephalotrichum gorgonifer TaxID=2041049 RepID=A0AAE8MQM8_9PEZI|nr:uncharacterized protein DNG_00330 [Cephalotrichum gorgonifer]
MDSISTYSLASLAWLTTQGAPLILWPSFISSLLGEEYHQSNPLEHYYARSLGVALITLGVMTVVLTGSVPLTSIPDDEPIPDSPYTTAILLLSTIHHASATLYAYTRYNDSSQTAFMIAAFASGALATGGLLALLFAGDTSRRSKTGIDKDTSSYPFTNSESYRSKKKAAKNK